MPLSNVKGLGLFVFHQQDRLRPLQDIEKPPKSISALESKMPISKYPNWRNDSSRGTKRLAEAEEASLERQGLG